VLVAGRLLVVIPALGKAQTGFCGTRSSVQYESKPVPPVNVQNSSGFFDLMRAGQLYFRLADATRWLWRTTRY